MPEAAATRLEHKVDTLIEAVSDLKNAHSRLTDQMVADKRLTDQLLGFMQQAVDRLQGEVDSDRTALRLEIEKEREFREKEVATVKATLSRIGFALFTSLLAVVGSVLAIYLTQK